MRHPSKKEYTLKNTLSFVAFVAVLLIGLALITGCSGRTQSEIFADNVSKYGTPEDATNITILDEYWYTFEWRGQCFLGTHYYRRGAVTKIDCES